MMVAQHLPCAAQDSVKRAPDVCNGASKNLILETGEENVSKVNLPEVSVTSHNDQPTPSFSQTPSQVSTSEEMERLGDVQLSDAMKRFAGVTLKDYGGVGGVKTVSARGLGSQFSTLVIDGVAVNDCQNGQVDLGRYMLAGSAAVSFHNGQEDSPLQSARSYAAGSVLSMETEEPVFGGRPFGLRLGIEGGSFGYLAPSLSYNQKLGRRSSLTLFASHTRSEGDYPYTLYYTASHGDSSSREVRENSQMRLTTVDANYFLRIDRSRNLHVKAHAMGGFHALPGPVVYYAAKGSEHSVERLFFAQGNYTKRGERLDVRLLGKYQMSSDVYEDTAARTPTGLLHNEYEQQEGYLSQAFRYHVLDDRLSLSFSADEAVGRLHSNLADNNEVQRLSALGVLAAEYGGRKENRGLRLNAHLLGVWMRDQRGAGANSQRLGQEPTSGALEPIASEAYKRLSPYAGASYTFEHLTLRYFFKETYRVPNFNELYYFTVGRSLRPEKAAQHNLGLTYHDYRHLRNRLGKHFYDGYVNIAVNGYYNRVSDKIIAIPTQNMFLWSMTNLGEVEILGLDITGDYRVELPLSLVGIELRAGYSYQHAVDVTDPESKTFRNQILYTPRHSGSIALTATSPWVDIGYSITFVGERYAMQQNTPACRLQGYADHGITLSHEFLFRESSLKLKAQMLNLLDVQYEVVKNYPMMGRNFRLGIVWAC